MKNKKKKSLQDTYHKMMAEYGTYMDPWQMQSQPQYYPQQQYAQNQQSAYEQYGAPSYNPTQQNATPPQQSSSKGNMQGIDSMAAGIGAAAGSIGRDVINGGVQFLNAIIPDNHHKKNTYTPPAYNPYSMGTGSQAIFADGGNIAKTNDPTYNAFSQVLMNRNRDKNFVDRAYNPQNYPVQDNNDGSYSTHRMAYDTNMDGTGTVYPTIVQMQNKQLKELSPDNAYDYAQENNEFITTPSWKMADYLSNRGYKNATGLDKKADGGEITKRQGKKKNIVTTEGGDSYYNPNPLPYQEVQQLPNQNYSPHPSQVQVPQMNPSYDFQPIFNTYGKIDSYVPVFSNASFGQARNMLSDVPDTYQDYPVQHSMDQMQELTQNFQPFSQSYQWKPYSDPSQGIDPSLIQYKDGGKVNPPIYSDRPNDPRVQRYADSLDNYEFSESLKGQMRNLPGFKNSRTVPNNYKEDTIPKDFMYANSFNRSTTKNRPASFEEFYNDTRNSEVIPNYTQPKQPIFQGLAKDNLSQISPIGTNFDVNTQVPQFNQVHGSMQTMMPYSEGVASYPGGHHESGQRMENIQYKEGGSISIKKSKRGSLHKALGVPQGEKIPSSKLQIHEGDSPSLKKKKRFALNAKKFKH